MNVSDLNRVKGLLKIWTAVSAASCDWETSRAATE